MEYYAHAINNLKKHGYWGPANKPYATEEEMKKSGWRDATHSYASGNIQTVNVHYKKFNEIRNDKSKFNTFIGATISLKATLKAILGYSEDTTNGAYQWIGGVGEVSPLDTTPEKYNAKDVVTIVTKTEFATYYHSFYKFAKE